MSDIETNLRLIKEDGTEVPFPENSATFIAVTIEPISSAGHFARTVNGRLVDLSDPAFRKLAISLSATDNRLPALADLYLGQNLVVECPITIRERGSVPSREAVPGSILLGSGWVEYRPVIECMLVGSSMSDTEWQPSASWALQLEEI